MDDILESAPEEVGEELDTFIDALVTARARTAGHVVVTGISIEARRLLEEMKSSNRDSQCFKEEGIPLNKEGDIRWTQGWRTCQSLSGFGASVRGGNNMSILWRTCQSLSDSGASGNSGVDRAGAPERQMRPT